MDTTERRTSPDSDAEKPLRSILKSAGAHSTTPPLPHFGPSTSGGRVRINEPSRPPAPIPDTSRLPHDGPVPPVTLPRTQNLESLEALAFQLATKLRLQRLRGEDDYGEQHAPNNTSLMPRPTRKPDNFPEFRHILMGKWVPGPDCESTYHLVY